MSEQGPGEVLQWLLESWTTRLADSIEGMTGERPAVTSQPLPNAPPIEETALWWEQPLSLRRDATFWAGAPEASWMAVGSLFLKGAGIEVTDPQDARNTYLEVLSQSCNGLAQAASRRLGTEVTCKNGKEGPPPGDSMAHEVEITFGETKVTLPICFSSSLLDALRTQPEEPTAPPVELASAAAAGAGVERPAGERTMPRTLDLLMEVELPVSVSFGRAQLALKDVLKLSTGSIVELNRAISEPVEVIVNNCVIARGEVVVVEGNYGVRINEIISRERRLRTLQ